VSTQHRSAQTLKTIIKFKFLKPVGFSLTGYGNFTPKMGMTPKKIPGLMGQFWEIGYLFDEVFEIKMAPEHPRDLPQHIADGEDEVTRSAYRVEQAKNAAANHEANNHHRDELYRLETLGYISITADSFYDTLEQVNADKDAANAPAPVLVPEANPPQVAKKPRGRPKGSTNKK
jgi:hypothetical protein